MNTKIKKILTFTALLFSLTFAGIYFFLRSSLSPMDGSLPLKNLSQEVTVWRDSFGIPHIQAQNKLDALRSLGFVNASERLFQMEMARRMTQGQLSEIFGELALSSDKLYRSLMLRRSVERMLAREKKEGSFDQKMWDEMEAYCNGINQYIATQNLPYELTLLGVHPQPFTPVDAYILVGHMAYSFGISLTTEPLMTKLSQKLNPEVFQSLRNDLSEQGTKSAGLYLKKIFSLATEGLFFPSFEGSNAWLVGPQKSTSGKSLFANDPHIGFSHPAVWAEAHISAPTFELYGHYLPSVPFAILGHNKHHAWGFTMSLTDDMDLYREVLDRKSKTVLFNGKAVPYLEWTEVIKVKNKPDVVLSLIETPHGPLMNEVLEERDLSLKWAFHRDSNNPLKALHNMAEAKSLKEFEASLQYGTAPGLNVMYADAQNIAWWMFGEIAVKKNPHSDQILDGSTGADEYQRILEWDEKPRLVNPPSGIIVTANSRPKSLAKNIRGDWQSNDRYATILEALQQKEKWGVEDFKRLQTKNYNVRTSVILKLLLEKLQLSQDELQKFSSQLSSLKQWNFESDTKSQAAALYHTWNNENILLMLEDLPSELRDTYLSTPFAWSFYEKTIANPKAPLWNDKNIVQLTTKGFKSAMEKLEDNPNWGSLHTIEFRHALGRFFPFKYLLNLGPYPAPGAYNDINNMKMRALGDNFKVTAGPSTRRIIDFNDPEVSWGIIPTGVSGHILSPFYKNQVDLFLRGEYRTQNMNLDTIARESSKKLILKPF